MILLRGINGEHYAQRINSCMVGFRDLLSTLLNTNYTGYNFSDYYEKYVCDVFLKGMAPRLNHSLFNSSELKKLMLIFNMSIPYFYLTYFHILNEQSEYWLEQFDDDMHFIYIEPIIEPNFQNMIGENYLGRRVDYIKNYNNYDLSRFIANTMGLSQFVQKGIENGVDINIAYNYSSLIANILMSLFNRVIDDRFNQIENEFRIVYLVPTHFNGLGELVPEEERIFNVLINGNNFHGRVEITRDSYNIKHCELSLQADSILIRNHKTELIEEILEGNTYKIDSTFKEINLQDSLKSYAYIGNKEDCREFIRRHLTM